MNIIDRNEVLKLLDNVVSLTFLINSDRIKEATYVFKSLENGLPESLTEKIYVILQLLGQRKNTVIKSRTLTVLAANVVREMIDDHFIKILGGNCSTLPRPSEKNTILKMLNVQPINIGSALALESQVENFKNFIESSPIFSNCHLFQSIISQVWFEAKIILNSVDFKNFERNFFRGLLIFYTTDFNTKALEESINTHLLTELNVSQLSAAQKKVYTNSRISFPLVLQLLKMKNKVLLFSPPVIGVIDKSSSKGKAFQSVGYLKYIFAAYCKDFMSDNKNNINSLILFLEDTPLNGISNNENWAFLNKVDIAAKFRFFIRRAPTSFVKELFEDIFEFLGKIQQTLRANSIFPSHIPIFKNILTKNIEEEHLPLFEPHLEEINDYPLRVLDLQNWIRNQTNDFKERLHLLKDFLLFIHITDLKDLEKEFGKVSPSKFIKHSQSITGKSFSNLMKTDKDLFKKIRTILDKDPSLKNIIDTINLWCQQFDYIHSSTYQIEPQLRECLELAPYRVTIESAASDTPQAKYFTHFMDAIREEDNALQTFGSTQRAPKLESKEDIKECKESKEAFKAMSLEYVEEDTESTQTTSKPSSGTEENSFEQNVLELHETLFGVLKQAKSKSSNVGFGTGEAFSNTAQHLENLFFLIGELQAFDVKDNKENFYATVVDCVSEGSLVLEQLLLGIDLFKNPLQNKELLPSRYSHDLQELTNRSQGKLLLNANDLKIILNTNKGEIESRRVPYYSNKDQHLKLLTEAQLVLHHAYQWLQNKDSKNSDKILDNTFKYCRNILYLSYKLCLIVNQTNSKRHVDDFQNKLVTLNKQIMIQKKTKIVTAKPLMTMIGENCKKEMEVIKKLLSSLSTEENVILYDVEIDNLLRNNFIILQNSVDSIHSWHSNPSGINLHVATILRKNHFIAKSVLNLILSFKEIDQDVEKMGNNLSLIYVKAGFNLDHLDKNTREFLEASYGTMNFTRYQSNYSPSDSKEGHVVKAMKTATQLQNKKEIILPGMEDGFEMVISSDGESLEYLQKLISDDLTSLRTLLEHILKH
ncbi:MAG: hypothetical protein H0W88_02890 [Parachlamydiaceae bacterium]|nr:hypothetical protein [Parachlamydiaceae bacterium]